MECRFSLSFLSSNFPCMRDIRTFCIIGRWDETGTKARPLQMAWKRETRRAENVPGKCAEATADNRIAWEWVNKRFMDAASWWTKILWTLEVEKKQKLRANQSTERRSNQCSWQQARSSGEHGCPRRAWYPRRFTANTPEHRNDRKNQWQHVLISTK